MLRQFDFTSEGQEERLQLILDAVNDGIWDWDLQNNEVYYSPRWKSMLGYANNEIGNTPDVFFDLIHKNDKEIVKNALENHFKEPSKNLYNIEFRMRTNDGTYKWILARGKVSLNELDEPIRILGTHTDIDDKKRLIEEVKTNKQRFENMFKNHDSIMLLVNPESGQIIDANLSAEHFYGYSYNEFINMKISDINVSNLNDINHKLHDAENSDKNCFEFQHKLKNGKLRTVEVHASPINTDNGKILFSIIKDITKEKALEYEVFHEKDFISTIIDNSNAVIAVIDSKGVMFKINKYAQKILGYTQDEISSKPYFWSIFLPKEQRSKVVDIIKKANKGEIVKHFKNSWISKYGEERIFEWSNTLVQKEDGTMDYLATIGIDITEKEKNQQQLIHQKQEFEMIFQYAQDGIALVDLESNFLDANNAYLNMFGYSKQELLSMKCIDLSITEDKEKSIQALKNAYELGFVDNFENKCLNKNGKRITVTMTTSLLPDKKRFLIISKDITNLKLIEEQTKLASMGEMLGNIAHQWRQPLSLISTVASTMQMKYELDGCLSQQIVEDYTNKILKQAEYLSKTIDVFKNFIKDENEEKFLSIKDVIEDSLSIVEASYHNYFIKINKNIDDDINILGNYNLLVQAFINILNNAKDAIINNTDLNGFGCVFIRTKKLDNNTLEVEICDNAGGINQNILSRVFEPYFTTKHQSQGTGLGLAMVDKIIREKHNQVVKAYNQSIEYNGKNYTGACFTIEFKTK